MDARTSVIFGGQACKKDRRVRGRQIWSEPLWPALTRWLFISSNIAKRMAWNKIINIREIIQKREDIRICFNDSHFLFVSLPPNCGLTSPATDANLWVCTSIKAIMISVTSWLTSMLTSHHWYHSSMQCSTLRTDYLMFMCRQTDNLWCKLPLWR